MKVLLMSCAAVALLAVPATGDDPTASDRLERAIHLEEARGDLAQSVRIYRQLIDDADTPQAMRNQAQQRLALAEQKRGVRVDSALEADPKPPAPVAAAADRPVAAAVQEAVQAIEEKYVHEIDRRKLLDTTLSALAQSLDDESEYLTAEQLRELSISFDQQLVGVGIQLQAEDGQITVVAAIPGSPAEKAGVLPGDRIVSIGDTRLADLPEAERLTTTVKLLRGPAGEAAAFKVERGGRTESLTATRATIELESVRGDVRGDNKQWQFLLDAENRIGYIRILSFSRKTAGEVRQALEQLGDVRGLILDLRDNPGGLLPQGTAVCDLFVDEGTIVSVRGRDNQTQTIEATREGTIKDLPLAVLVNRMTASAAEIVASCLFDHQRAVLIGERTYGRGTVKSLVPLTESGGALKLTTGVFVRPNGETIHRTADAPADAAVGVAPSPGLEVAYSDEELQQHHQFRQARDLNPDAQPPAGYEDRQLAKALSYLREQLKK